MLATMGSSKQALSIEMQFALNEKLLKMLTEQLINRFKYYADQWQQESTFRRFSTNPFLSVLTEFETSHKTSRTETKEAQDAWAKTIVTRAKALEKKCDDFLPKLGIDDSLSKSIEALYLAEGILQKSSSSPLSAAEVRNPLQASHVQDQAICSDVVLRECYESLRGAADKHGEKKARLAKRNRDLEIREKKLGLDVMPDRSNMTPAQQQRYEPLYLQANDRRLLQSAALPLIDEPEDSDQSFSKRGSVMGDALFQASAAGEGKHNLRAAVTDQLASLYMDIHLAKVAVSEKELLASVDEKTHSFWDLGFGSSEFRTVKALLKEAGKATPDSVAVERLLKRLERKTVARALVSQPLTIERPPTIREKVLRLYECDPGASNNTVFEKVKNLSASAWNLGMDSSELKTVKLLLTEAEKQSSDDKIVQSRLERLIKFVQARAKKDKQNQWRAVQNVDAPVSVSVSAPPTTEVKPIDVIRVEFAEARIAQDVAHLTSITSGERQDALGLIARERVVQQYEQAKTSAEGKSFKEFAIDKEKLPSNIHDLQALVYFIFKHNDKEVPSKFPVSWTMKDGLRIARGGDFASLLTPPAKLSEALFTSESRSYYFAVLMVSIALMGATQTGVSRDEYIGLRTILTTLLNAQSGVVINNALQQLPANLRWLSNYMPAEIDAPACDSKILPSVRTVLLGEDQTKGMFPQLSEESTVKAAPVLEAKKVNIDIIDNLNTKDFQQLVISYAERIEKRSLYAEELYSLLETLIAEKKADAALSNKFLLLKVLLKWYDSNTSSVNNTADEDTFRANCVGLANRIKSSNSAEITISLTNKKALAASLAGDPAIGTTVADLRSDRSKLSQNLYRKGVVGHRRTSADRLVDVVYDLFPDGRIQPNSSRVAFTGDELVYIANVVATADAIRNTPPIKYRIEENLRAYSDKNPNPKTLAAYTLCQWYKLTTGGVKNIKNADFLKQFEQMENRLLSALTKSEPNYPTDHMIRLIEALKKQHKSLLSSADGLFGTKPSSLSLLLDQLEKMPVSQLFQLPARVPRDAIAAQFPAVNIPLSDEQRLKQKTDLLRRTIQDVKGDGNCFFYALAHQLSPGIYATDAATNHAALRGIAAREVKGHAGYYNQHCISEAQQNAGYISKIENDGVYVGDEVVEAMARYLDRVIVVVSSLENAPPRVFKPKNASNLPPIVLGYVNGNHYQSLQYNGNPSDDPLLGDIRDAPFVREDYPANVIVPVAPAVGPSGSSEGAASKRVAQGLSATVATAAAVSAQQPAVSSEPWWKVAPWVADLEAVLITSVLGLTKSEAENVVSGLPDPGDNLQQRKLIAICCLIHALGFKRQSNELVNNAELLLSYIQHPMNKDVPTLSLSPFSGLSDSNLASLKTLNFSSLGNELSTKIQSATRETKFTVEEVEKIYTHQEVQEHYSNEVSVVRQVQEGVFQERSRFAWLPGNYESVGMLARMISNWQMGYVSESDRMGNKPTPWLQFEKKPLSELLTLYASAQKDSVKQKEYKMQIDDICGPGARQKLIDALYQFHASSKRRSNNADITEEARHVLPTHMEAIVVQLKNSSSPLAKILCNLRKGAQERKEATCTSRFFVGRRSETSQGYACINDYLFGEHKKEISTQVDFDAFIEVLSDSAVVKAAAPIAQK